MYIIFVSVPFTDLPTCSELVLKMKCGARCDHYYVARFEPCVKQPYDKFQVVFRFCGSASNTSSIILHFGASRDATQF